MAAGEQFCLRWNDFEANISRAFQDLREEKDFLDVTLACDDEKQIKVHKVILSACSPFFRNVLRKNPHDHPLLYLKGVKYAELQSILNFMYYGEVNVAHEDLNGFLSVAEDLKIKGLTQSDSKKGETKDIPERPVPKQKIRDHPVPDPGPPPKRPRPIAPALVPVPKSQDTLEDEIEEIRPAIKTEPGPAYSSSIAVQEEHEADNSSADGFGGEGYDYVPYEEGNSEGFANDSMIEHNAEGSGSIVDGNKDVRDALFGHLMTRTMDPTLGRSVWKCTACGKMHKGKNVIRDHIEVHHCKTLDYPCSLCQKVCKTRDSFKKHLAVHSKNERIAWHTQTHNIGIGDGQQIDMDGKSQQDYIQDYVH